MNAKKSVIIGFLSGAAVGSIVALLYAPQKGKYLREDIKRKAVKTVDDVSDYMSHAASRASDAMQKVLKKTPKAA